MLKKDKVTQKQITPIKGENLSVCFQKNKIIKELNFKIDHKDITAVIGPNGAGKTILLHTINGLTHIENGKITFNSYLNNKNFHIIRGIILVNLQEYNLYKGDFIEIKLNGNYRPNIFLQK